jgi:membrane-associated protease RseP (regulator of RpoE activity)
MYTKTMGILAILFMIVGCAGGGAVPGVMTHGISPSPELGITADPELKVVAVYPGSAAEKAGVQIGDILVDVTWIPMDEAPADYAEKVLNHADDTVAPEEIVTKNADSTIITTQVPVTVGRPINGVFPQPSSPLPPGNYMVKEPVQFINIKGAISLVGYGFPLSLRVIRNGEEVTIKITPTVRVMNYGPNNPVPTLAPGDWYGY